MKRMLLLFFVLVGLVALGSVAVESDDYRINDPPGVEFLGEIAHQSFDYPAVNLEPIQVFQYIRLPEIDDWPALGELFINDPYALFNNYYKDCAKANLLIPPNMTPECGGLKEAEKRNRNWIKSYSMEH